MILKKNILPTMILALVLITALLVVVPGIHLSGERASFQTSVYSTAISNSSSSASSSSTSSTSYKSSTSTTTQHSTTPSVQTCLDNTSMPAPISAATRIAFVKSLFTATAYDSGGFYAFYDSHRHANGTISSNLQELNRSVSNGNNYYNGWGHNIGLYDFLISQSARNCGLFLGTNLFILSDINIAAGALFYPNGTNMFNVVIAGFSEYATLEEYNNYKHFVTQGGTLILMDSDSFEVHVGYSQQSNYEWLIQGHGWAFNGTRAWHSIWNPWVNEDINWVGSNLSVSGFNYTGATLNLQNPIGASLGKLFGARAFSQYHSHEENAVRNMTLTSIIATFGNDSGRLVASYTHHYQKGLVICFCVFGTDIILSDMSAQYFLVESIALAMNGQLALSALVRFNSTSNQSVVASSVGIPLTLINSFASLAYFFKCKRKSVGVISRSDHAPSSHHHLDRLECD